MNGGRRIYWLAVSFCGQKTDGSSGLRCILVQAVTESSDYPENIDLARGPKQNFQLDLAFDPQPASFLV